MTRGHYAALAAPGCLRAPGLRSWPRSHKWGAELRRPQPLGPQVPHPCVLAEAAIGGSGLVDTGAGEAAVGGGIDPSLSQATGA
jgi:hypothetical protein